MTSLSDKNISEERLCVIVGTAESTQLLGVPRYSNNSDETCGNKVTDLTIELLQTWHCTDSVVNMTFDTTASNTGHISAACISIQQKLNKALLWSGCRHHIGKIVLSHVFDDLKIETSKSPDIALFSRFRKNFHSLNNSFNRSSLSGLNSSLYSPTIKHFIDERKTDVLR